uniref:RING-type domain-containing protein n=1 Tax=Trypanosoma congolense (strain IL3000) TaxID=1068625 RepID=G0UJ67_TRYCI|nr:conserved hypothetical protein [Trypanosoma congolense IL3000]
MSNGQRHSFPPLANRHVVKNEKSIAEPSLEVDRRFPAQQRSHSVSELFEKITTQQQEIQRLTDSLNAVQRNFERLGELHRKEREELERLRASAAANAQERLELEAVRAEWARCAEKESENVNALVEKEKENRELLSINEKLRKEVQEALLSRGKERQKEDEMLRIKTWELGEVRQRVLKFATEVKNRIESLSLGSCSFSQLNERSAGGNKLVMGRGGISPQESESGFAVEKGLCEAWDCVDKVCLALCEARIARDTKREEDLVQRQETRDQSLLIMSIMRALDEVEYMRRGSLCDEEEALRECICGSWNALHDKNINTYRSALDEVVRVEEKQRTQLVLHQMQNWEHVCEKALSSLQVNMVGVCTALDEVSNNAESQQQNYENRLQNLEKKVKEDEMKWHSEQRMQCCVHQLTLTAQEERAKLLLEEATEHLTVKFEKEKEELKMCVGALEEETRRISLLLSQASMREEKLHVTLERSHRGLGKELELVFRASSTMLQRYEEDNRNWLETVEKLKRELMRGQEEKVHESSSISKHYLLTNQTALGLAVGLAEASIDLRSVFCRMVEERTNIAREAMSTMYRQQLMEARDKAKEDINVALAASREELDQLQRDMEETRERLRSALDEKERLDQENKNLSERVESAHKRTEDQSPAEVIETKKSLKAILERLLVAEEATECAFSCGLCMHLLKSPLTCVPCGHTFCEECLLKLPQNVRGVRAASTIETAAPMKDKESSELLGGVVSLDSDKRPFSLRHCPECGSGNCNMTMRVQVVDVFSGNLNYRRKDTALLRSILAMMQKESKQQK